MLRPWPLTVLLLACGHEPAASLITETPPVMNAAEDDAEPGSAQTAVPHLGPGHRCAKLGVWERPAAPCIVEAEARIRVPQLRFEPTQGTMDEPSLAAVDAVAALLLAHPEIGRLELHAHTDSTDSHHD